MRIGFALLALFAAWIPIGALGADDRPNILWITCEDISPNLGCYGDEYAVTPNLDRLATQSVRYTEAYAPIHVRKGEGQRGLKLAVDNDAKLDAAANEPNIEGNATEYVDDLDEDDDSTEPDEPATDGEPHE